MPRNGGVAFFSWINGFIGIFPFCFPATLFLICRGLEEGEEPSGRNDLRLIQDRLNDAEFCNNLAVWSRKLAGSAGRRFQFQKCRLPSSARKTKRFPLFLPRKNKFLARVFLLTGYQAL